MEQQILTADNNYAGLDDYISGSGISSIMLVCDDAFRFLKIKDYFDALEDRLGVKLTVFSGFKPNPAYESVVEGVKLFNDNDCKMIIAVGGGSAMDVAKCIKLYSNMDHSKNYLEQDIKENGVKLLAVPTTAGTGSEATRYAVIYYKGEKQSVSDYSCIPSVVLFDETALKTLPVYQKKSTMLDALCHAVESFWSVNSTAESMSYSMEAIELIIRNKDKYLENDDDGNRNMLYAANTAGKAINITQTTAGHAMCYKLTSLYGIAHGHAAALCVSKLWRYMINNTDKCIDPRGEEHINAVFTALASAFGAKTAEGAVGRFDRDFSELEMDVPETRPGDIDKLKVAVNPTRLKNNSIGLDVDKIEKLYKEILG